jgi:hypothetical protein
MQLSQWPGKHRTPKLGELVGIRLILYAMVYVVLNRNRKSFLKTGNYQQNFAVICIARRLGGRLISETENLRVISRAAHTQCSTFPEVLGCGAFH